MRRYASNFAVKHSLSNGNAFFTAATAAVPPRELVQKGFVTPMRDVANSVQHPDYSLTGRPKPSPK